MRENIVVLAALSILSALPAVATAAPKYPDASELKRMIARFAPTRLEVDTKGLSAGDKKALVKLIQAARAVDDLFMTQYWKGDHELYAQLQKDRSTLGKERLHYFWIMKGPWSSLDGNTAFLPNVPERKPPGSNFYPEDMTKEEFEAWVKTLSPADQERATGFFTVISRGADRKLAIVPYSVAYKSELGRMAQLLRDAASDTDNASLKRFLNSRADAFLTNEYADSDMAWMDLDAPLDVTFGPYETYNDELFGYKAAFEAYITLKDANETAKLAFFSDRLQEVENNLPEDPKFHNPKLGAASPIRVVNQVIATGDGAHGIRTAAFNLPNDEAVVKAKGSKRVMLKNVQEAKFKSILLPIAGKVLSAEDRKHVAFDPFFTHILAHELSHGIGPHEVTAGGKHSDPRMELKDTYSALEECKADVTGLFMLQYLFDHPLGSGGGVRGGAEAERALYTTYLASTFRSIRFGITEAHGKGTAIQFNYFLSKGGYVRKPNGTYTVDVAKMKQAVRDLDHELLTLEATGDYAGAKAMLAKWAVIDPALQKSLDALKPLPNDIEPIDVTADRLAPKP